MSPLLGLIMDDFIDLTIHILVKICLIIQNTYVHRFVVLFIFQGHRICMRCAILLGSVSICVVALILIEERRILSFPTIYLFKVQHGCTNLIWSDYTFPLDCWCNYCQAYGNYERTEASLEITLLLDWYN